MKTEIEKATSVLTGRKLWRCTRAADLAAFQFGERRTSRTFDGEPCEIGEYALHVQCSWRIAQGDKVIVGRNDLYYPAAFESVRDEFPRNFKWDVQGANRQDRLVKEFFEDGTRSYLVERVDVGEAGALRIALEDGIVLEVFPDDSLDGEHWRLFAPDSDGPHFVVTGHGIED